MLDILSSVGRDIPPALRAASTSAKSVECWRAQNVARGRRAGAKQHLLGVTANACTTYSLVEVGAESAFTPCGCMALLDEGLWSEGWGNGNHHLGARC